MSMAISEVQAFQLGSVQLTRPNEKNPIEGKLTLTTPKPTHRYSDAAAKFALETEKGPIPVSDATGKKLAEQLGLRVRPGYSLRQLQRSAQYFAVAQGAARAQDLNQMTDAIQHLKGLRRSGYVGKGLVNRVLNEYDRTRAGELARAQGALAQWNPLEASSDAHLNEALAAHTKASERTQELLQSGIPVGPKRRRFYREQDRHFYLFMARRSLDMISQATNLTQVEALKGKSQEVLLATGCASGPVCRKMDAYAALQTAKYFMKQAQQVRGTSPDALESVRVALRAARFQLDEVQGNDAAVRSLRKQVLRFGAERFGKAAAGVNVPETRAYYLKMAQYYSSQAVGNGGFAREKNA
jgi:hypothetical protein